MADEILVLKGQGNVDVQVGGPGNKWQYLSACASMSGPTVPKGETEIRWCQDPQVAGGFRISSKFRTAPDQITFDLLTKLGKIDYLADLDCPFSLRARYASGGVREDPNNYNPIMLAYCPVDIQEVSYDDLAVTDPGDNDEILVTSPSSASYEYRVKKLTPSRLGTAATLGDQAINDIEYCDAKDCVDSKGKRRTGCSVLYAVTDADSSPYAAPGLIKIDVDVLSAVTTITNNPILGINGNVDAVECAGSRIVVTSNADSVFAYNSSDGDQDEWNVVALANAPAARHSALFAESANVLWIGAANGYIYKSVDGGLTFSAVHEGGLTSETINAVFAANQDLVYAVGNNGVILKSVDSGATWSDITETSTTGANLLVVIVPPDRLTEVYIGANNGTIYRSKDEGETFAAISFDGDGIGTIDDISFCGPCGSESLFILHNDGGPRGRILRDLSGGAGGADVEIVSNYTQVITAGIQLNALACCNQNEVMAAGELSSSFPIIIKGA